MIDQIGIKEVIKLKNWNDIKNTKGFRHKKRFSF